MVEDCYCLLYLYTPPFIQATEQFFPVPDLCKNIRAALAVAEAACAANRNHPACDEARHLRVILHHFC